MLPLSGHLEICTFPGRKDKEWLILQDFCLYRDILDHQECLVSGLEHSISHTKPPSSAFLVVALTQTGSIPLNILATQLQVPGEDYPLEV